MERQEHKSPNLADVGLMSDDSIQEVILLAKRLRETAGGELDDSAILAIAEATGAPADYVRLAIHALPVEKNMTPWERVRTSFLAFNNSMRRYMMSGVLAALSGLSSGLSRAFDDVSSLLGTLTVLFTVGAIYNCAIAKDAKAGALAGAIYGSTAFLTTTLFIFLANLAPGVAATGPEPFLILVAAAGGAAAGAAVQGILASQRKRLGIKDQADQRQELLQQLLALQDELRSDERFVTFLSVDIVGSTQIKAVSDELAVEFTFTEYHKFVEAVVRQNNGRIHSTAGDGVTAAFDSPTHAYSAGRQLLAGLFEFNAFRNRIGSPVVLRGGLHTGSVLTPGEDITSVNFAHVIDIAAHMQKASPVGCLAVSEATATYLPGGLDAIGSERVETMDVAGAVWRPRNTVTVGTQSTS